MTTLKNIFRYLWKTTSLRLWYPNNFGFFVLAYSDANLGGRGLDRKSTTGSYKFFIGKLVIWQSKKRMCVSLFAVASCTSQIIWIQSQLSDSGLSMKRIPLYCDFESVICICHKLVQHSKTKNITLRYHFLKDPKRIFIAGRTNSNFYCNLIATDCSHS